MPAVWAQGSGSFGQNQKYKDFSQRVQIDKKKKKNHNNNKGLLSKLFETKTTKVFRCYIFPQLFATYSAKKRKEKNFLPLEA